MKTMRIASAFHEGCAIGFLYWESAHALLASNMERE
jgi:hypothetical protein